LAAAERMPFALKVTMRMARDDTSGACAPPPHLRDFRHYGERLSTRVHRFVH
jgi:hypothetical protein